MKTSGLFIGLGVGLLVGAAVGAYLISSDEQKAEWMDEINSTVNNAKKAIGKVVDEGKEELDKAAEKITKVAQDTISKAKQQMA
jgi:gas vesicle protein